MLTGQCAPSPLPSILDTISQSRITFSRFGSQVNDKNKKVKEKCVVAKVLLFLPSGEEAPVRPPTDRCVAQFMVQH